MATAVGVTRTNNAEIDGLLGGVKWSGTISYSFPGLASTYAALYGANVANYGGNSEPTKTGFAPAPAEMAYAVAYAMELIQGYTNASIQYNGNGTADIMVAQSPAANPTSYAYYPGNVPAGGDIWFGNAYNYSLATLGNYYFVTALHELGHALGLKHAQETGGVAGVAVPAAHDNSEYTVMSYRSYAGAPLTGYTSETYGYAQTYMANDILALQTLYGANFATRAENTTYSWSPSTGQMFINGAAQAAPAGGNGGSANRIFETIWDGNGVDTYDLSNYSTALTINLNPGAASVFSSTQLAYLGNGHYAAGNVYNAYLFNGDTRSYIDNAVGGSGNDSITGNAIANVLNGGGGDDVLTGGGGNDTIIGGAGTDTAVFSGARSSYAISYNAATQTFTVADQRSGSPDGVDTVTGVESLLFSGAAVASVSLIGPDLMAAFDSVSSAMIVQGGSTLVDFWLVNLGSAVSASTTGIYLSTDATITTSDLLLTTVSSAALSAGNTPGYFDHRTVTLNLPGSIAPGTYYVGGIADYTNAIAEGNEANNNHDATRITIVGPSKPDLIAAFDAVGSTTIMAGGHTTADFWLVNAGNAPAAASTTGIYLSTDATITTSDLLITSIASGSLAAMGGSGYYDHRTLSLTVPGSLAPGTYYIGAIADTGNAVAEANEANNNHDATRITVTQPRPDLVAAFDSVSSSTIVQGGSTLVDFWLVNFGSMASTASNTGIYLSTDATIDTADTLLTTITSGALGANGASGYYDHRTVTLTMPGNLAPGTYYIGGYADVGNLNSEGNELNNNHDATRITIGPSHGQVAQPDLIAAFDAVSSTTIAAGGNTSVDFWLVNSGGAAASASTTGIYLSTDAIITSADTLLTTVTSGSLAANGASGYYDHQTVTLTVPGGLAPGTYYIGGLADIGNGVAEGNEANNNHDVTQITVMAPSAASAAGGALFAGSGDGDVFVFVDDGGRGGQAGAPNDAGSAAFDPAPAGAPPGLAPGPGALTYHPGPDGIAPDVSQHHWQDFHLV